MRRPIAMCAALGAAAAIAGCGGSKPSSSTTSTTTTTITTRSNATTTASTPTSTSPTATGETSPPTTSTSAAAPKTKTKTKTKASSGSGGVAPQPPAGGGSHGTKVKKPAGGSAGARVPATFTISRGGSVSPPTVSAPAFLAISLTVVSGDGEPHRVRVLTLAPHVLNVPAGGRASTLIGGLKAGTYAVQIDGKTRAKLVIGGEPGP